MRIEKKKKNMTMMKKRHILHWAMGVVMTPLLGSCAFDELYEIAGGGDGMSFSVEVTQLQEELGSSFRAPRITDTEISGDNMKMYVRRTTEGYVHRHEAKGVATRGISVSSIDKFILNSYTYSTSLSSATQVSTDEEITKSDGWKSQKQWQKASDKMAFYAYYAGTSSANFSLSGENPTLSYTIADDVANQQDLLVAKAENVTGDGTNKNIGLTFSHALTAVQFGIGSTMANGTIKKIELQGIMSKGTYNYSDEKWSSQSENKTYTLNNLNIDISDNKGKTSGTTLITGQGSNNDLMLLMPQTLGADAKLVVTIESNGTSHVLTMNLSGTWSPGHTVTYSLSTTKETGDYVLKVGSTSLSTNEAGGDVSTTVTSYYQDYYGTQSDVAWTATYTYAPGTDMRTPLDKAISNNTVSGSGGTSGEPLSATIANQYLKSQYNFTVDADLKTKAQNSASPFDLSTYNPATGEILSGTAKSANCYIIKAPGYYKLPLVFGNTLNNLTNANGNGSETFKDANDTPITTEIINGVKGAKLLWQDEYGLIEPSSIRVDGNYLYFEIKEGSITQGNALIAATSGENGNRDILWSWHIWVTDADFQSTVLIYGGASFNYNNTSSTSGRKEFYFMKMPLGFCNSTTLKYPERKIVATIKQTGTGDKETSVTITQTGSSSAVKSYGENCTFYQWGRKDPFPGSDGNLCNTSNYNKSTPKYCYDADGNSFEYKKVGGDTSNGRTSKGGSIKNPYTFFYSLTTSTDTDPANDWCNETTYNNWSSNVTDYTFDDTEVVKSLYDPCPIGFKVPETTCFTGFTKTGNNVYNTSSNYNVSSETFNEGWYFYTTGWRSGTTDFWRAFGFIDCWVKRYDDYTPLESREGITGRGFLGWSGLYGHYWSARASSAGFGRRLHFNSGRVTPRSYDLRADGFSVRPVSE